MGTNYYWKEVSAKCECCGNDPAREWHIGKSSVGWCFSLNTHPEKGLHSLDDWCEAWATGAIRDEYHSPIPVKEMVSNIMDRTGRAGVYWGPDDLKSNHAVMGPNHLLRHKIDGRHCISHGEGPYDLMRGEFS